MHTWAMEDLTLEELTLDSVWYTLGWHLHFNMHFSIVFVTMRQKSNMFCKHIWMSMFTWVTVDSESDSRSRCKAVATADR